MKSILSKPQNWFFIAIPLFYFSVLLYEGNSAVDIQLHDTMYVISKELLCLIPVGFFFIWGGLHFIVRSYFKYQPNKVASLVHFIITVGSVLVIIIWAIYLQNHPVTTPVTSFQSYVIYPGIYVLTGIMFAFIITQAVFFLYLIVLLLQSLRR